MAQYTIRVFNAQNLRNESGEQSFASGSTSAPSGVSGVFTHGDDSGFTISILDNDPSSGNGDRDDVFDDGTGAQQFLQQPATFTYGDNGSVVTTTFPVGTQVQAELTQTFSNGFETVAIRVNTPATRLVTVGYTFIDPGGNPTVPPPGTELGTVTGGSSNGTTPIDEVACFTDGALLRTGRGDVAVEHVAVGDLLWTKSSGLCPVVWIGHQHISRADLWLNRNIRPVLLFPEALGANRRLLVSPQHRFLIGGPMVQLLFGVEEVFVPAIAYCDVGLGRQVLPPNGVTYRHVGLEPQAAIYAEGIWTESLLDWSRGLELDSAPTQDAAYPCLTRREANVLLSTKDAPAAASAA